MRKAAPLVLGLMIVGLAAGCQETGDDGISVDATGAVNGLVWLDRDGNGILEAFDGRIPEVRVRLHPRSGGPSLYSAETNAAGEFLFPSVMVGDYQAVTDTASVGDTLRVLRVDSASPTVAAGDTVTVVVGLTFPHGTVDSVRGAAVDLRFFVEGEVISRWNTFADGTLHVRDTTGAIRGLRVQPTAVALGDKVRLLGTTSVQAGRPVLKDVRVFLVETGVQPPDPVAVNTGDAASASAASLDADLVRVLDAVIEDTLRNSFNELILRVNDGSGPLDVVLDRDIGFSLNFPPDSVLGIPVDATGILLPPASGATDTWVLKPRANADIQVNS